MKNLMYKIGRNAINASQTKISTKLKNKVLNTYINLYRNKFCHSVECYDENKLIGGLYGVHIGSCFFGESMFSNVSNSSKFCLLYFLFCVINVNVLKL